MIWIAIAVIIAGYLIAQAIEKSNRGKTYQGETPIGNSSVEPVPTDDMQEKYRDKYPHLVGKIENSWLDVFGGMYVEKGLPHLRAAQNIYLKADNNTKQDNEVDFLLCHLWDLTNELLEHLDKYHESTRHEYEIAIVNYWEKIATEAESFDGVKDQELIRRKMQSPPYTDLQEIVFWFPKKKGHPKKEITFKFPYVGKKAGPFPLRRNFPEPDFIEKKLQEWDAAHGAK